MQRMAPGENLRAHSWVFGMDGISGRNGIEFGADTCCRKFPAVLPKTAFPVCESLIVNRHVLYHLIHCMLI
jgi:hypothetical protein